MATRPGRITAIRDLSDRARMVSVEAEGEAFQFQAGQHVKLGLRPENSGISGPYSIASPPKGTRDFDVLMNLVAHSQDSPYEAFKPGVNVLIDGPKGRFLFRPHAGRRAVFIAGGTGIAPLRSMILDAMGKGTDQPILLVLAARRSDHLYFVGDWERLQASAINFHYLPILSEPDSRWTGRTGLPMDHVKEIGQGETDDFYLCGPPEMVKLLKSSLSENGVGLERIYTEW